MINENAWQIFKNTGSVEAYITFSQTRNMVDGPDADDDKDKWNNSENQ